MGASVTDRDGGAATAAGAAGLRLEQFFFGEVTFRGLFVIRALLGLLEAYFFLHLFSDRAALFGPEGVNGTETLRRFPRYVPPLTEGMEKWEVLSYIESPAFISALHVLLIVAALGFALGCFTRPAGLVMIGLHFVFSAHQPMVVWGWAKLFPLFALYVTLAPSGSAWSVDAWRQRRKREKSPRKERAPKESEVRSAYTFSAWPLRLLQIHLIAMYLTAGFPRFVQSGWRNGEMVFHAVADSRYGRFGLDWFALKPLLTGATYFAFMLEPLAVLLLPFRPTRRYCALALLCLHVGIEVVADTGMWQYLMVAAVLSFLPDEWFRWVPGLRK